MRSVALALVASVLFSVGALAFIDATGLHWHINGPTWRDEAKPERRVFDRCSMVQENALWTARFSDPRGGLWACYHDAPSSHPCLTVVTSR